MVPQVIYGRFSTKFTTKKNYGLIPIWHSSKGQKKALDGLLENFIEMIPKAIPKASLIFMLLPEKVEHLNRDQY